MTELTKEEKRAAHARCRAGKATDADRIALAETTHFTVYGPVELQRCQVHPRNTEAYRWTWEPGGSVEDSTPEYVRGCPRCAVEAAHDQTDDPLDYLRGFCVTPPARRP